MPRPASPARSRPTTPRARGCCARGSSPSVRPGRRRPPAATLAGRRAPNGGLAQTIYVARTANDDLAKRQRIRRAQSRDEASDRTRSAVITVVVAGGLALLGALALIVALIGSIRRPLDELVDATKELAGGDLSKRVDPSGPQELRELDTAFNTMAEQLQGRAAGSRPSASACSRRSRASATRSWCASATGR